MHTTETHAGTMFGIVKQLAVRTGTVEKRREGENGKKGNGSMGHRPLGRDANQAKKQDAKNEKLLKAVTESGRVS
ncbi:hypothetical protein FRC12_023819 [Ceratobasidium sp. 428]|nr:hypothetical protein FRC12_023819 [Ceratobasidium sp. 428]